MAENLKVLMIGSDRKLFEDGSVVAKRIVEYGDLVNELHIVVFALKSLGLKEKQLSPKVRIYPTNSTSRWLYVRDGAKLGKKIVFDKKFVRGESLVTTQDPFESGLTGLRVKKRWRLPLEVQLHTDPFSPDFSGALNILRKIIARRVLKHADSVRVVSEHLKQNIARFTDARVNTLPIFVDVERIESGQPKFDLHSKYGWHFVILLVSRLTPEKKISTALEALKIVREKYSDIGMVIVGSGPEEYRLKKLAKSLGVREFIEFVGWQEDLASFYKTANVFLQTSEYEGYGLSLIEAGLSGLPVITTPVGIAQELESRQDAFIYPVGHSDLFAEGIMELIENNEKREYLRVNMMHALKPKLKSKGEYLNSMQKFWQETATKIK